MASNRHLGRIIVLQSLYEIAFRESSEDDSMKTTEVISRNISRYKAAAKDGGFITKFAEGILKNVKKLDEQLQPLAPDWPLEQIARIDHIILQMGAYELQYHDDVPPKVVINESVELAKEFGGENSSKFINGVLGTLLKSVKPEYADSQTEEPTKKEDNEREAKEK